MAFRDEIFLLCKKIQKLESVKSIKSIMRKYSIVEENEDKEGEMVIQNQAQLDFGYVSKHASNQFYGYLYTNEHVAEYKSMFSEISNLEKDEEIIFQQAHATILKLIEGCLCNFKEDFPQIYKVANPYSKYKAIKTVDAESFLKDEDYKKVISAFHNSKVLRKLQSPEIMEAFHTITEEHMFSLVGMLEKEMTECPPDMISEEIEGFIRNTQEQYKKIEDVLMAETILIVSVRRMLEMACQLLFIALIGEDLSVFNNDNIINIEKSQSNMLYKMMVILCDGIYAHHKSSSPGNIVLVDCDPAKNHHIHEFGLVRSSSMSMNNELGATTQYTLIIVDDEFNMFYQLTNHIIDKEFPKVYKGDEDTDTKKTGKKIYPNEKCPCGSGKKYKYCCGKN